MCICKTFASQHPTFRMHNSYSSWQKIWMATILEMNAPEPENKTFGQVHSCTFGLHLQTFAQHLRIIHNWTFVQQCQYWRGGVHQNQRMKHNLLLSLLSRQLAVSWTWVAQHFHRCTAIRLQNICTVFAKHLDRYSVKFILHLHIV